VSIHALACAAYEIIHVVSKKRNPERQKLIFDSILPKDEYRGKINAFLKSPANFFKHAKNDTDATIEFMPKITELFLLFSIAGIELAGERLNETESAFNMWLHVNRPDLSTDHWREMFTNSLPVHRLENIKSVPRNQFLQMYHEAWIRLPR
jgi:hypothetical protein